jgi:hypothetical protein
MNAETLSAALGHPPVRHSIRWGVAAASGMALFYATVVAGASGSLGHLGEQVRSDWYLLGPIIAGFGIQAGLVAELRRRRRLVRGAAVAGAAGSGGSAVGMVACCAHHLVDVVPFLAVTGAATFLVTYRLAFMGAGLVATAAGITVAVRRLRHLPSGAQEETVPCAVH